MILWKTPPMEMPLQSPPPLDSDMDWLIESVLLEDEQAVSAEFWISDDDHVDSITDSSTGATDVSESTPSESAPADSDTSVVETPLQPSPALDPVINSHTDSESSGGKDSISEDVRTPESEPLHPVSDSSTVSMPPASRDDPEGPDADSGGGEAVYASMQSVLPCAHHCLYAPGIER
ncbi:uncharacterized protein EMH_0062880 [Eimeria mitis]|uniref:Uncharacterized protein n=1 Tax=Eimeria mitis TaxID=44415 RepID=U6K3R7_9EIME|nr:uncharacterized protein EMH_0062880 [Eimeria mitis]CDJ30972.1 hypothetical protein EMH_0062880 [Eimeria mitis]